MFRIVRKKPRPWRCLREYRSIANKHYDCCNCKAGIHPGMPYFAKILVSGKWLLVQRFHDFCPEDPVNEPQEQYWPSAKPHAA